MFLGLRLKTFLVSLQTILDYYFRMKGGKNDQNSSNKKISIENEYIFSILRLLTSLIKSPYASGTGDGPVCNVFLGGEFYYLLICFCL